MADALLEIGCEEIPARFVDQCLADLVRLLTNGLAEHRLSTPTTTIQSVATYRRLGFIIRDILPKQADIDDEMQGPPLTIAKSDDGEWLPPAVGFAKKCGVDLGALTQGVSPKGQPIVCAKRFQTGADSAQVLPIVFKAAIQQMKLPIAMTWGRGQGPFIPPIQWICSLLDTSPLAWDVFSIEASNKTFGHRFLSESEPHALGKEVVLDSVNDYMDALRDVSVIVDRDERKVAISTQLSAFNTINDDALFNEVLHLVEYPTVLEIPFPESFLTLPRDVLVECLKKHQKAFLVESNGKLKNTCLVVADSVTSANKATIIRGNQRVMLARLNDVQFFWDEDVTTAAFDLWNERLTRVVFQDGLGSIADKVTRMVSLGAVVLDAMGAPSDLRKTVQRAIVCSKADLVSQMVMELPTLQGTMGGFYARKFNEGDDVAMAIADHYAPRFDGDAFPRTVAGAIVSIVDRLDTMVACYENNAIPTGSRDPWGIRRSMMAIIRMVDHFQLQLNLTHLIEQATLGLNRTVGDNTAQCVAFFKKRFETVLIGMGISNDVIQWVLPNGMQWTLHAIDAARSMQAIKETNPTGYALLVESMGRVAKIIDGFNDAIPIDSNSFEHDIEHILNDNFKALKEKNPRGVFNDSSIPNALDFCTSLTVYFEDVLVNADNNDVARNRKSLLKEIRDYFYGVGDWLQLVK